MGQSHYIDGGDYDHNQTRVEAVLSKEDVTGNEVLDCQITSNCDDDNRQNFELRNEEPPEIRRESQSSPTNPKSKLRANPPANMSEYQVKYGLQLDDVIEEQEADAGNNEIKFSEQSGTDMLHNQGLSPAPDRGVSQADQENKNTMHNSDNNSKAEHTGI